MESKFNIPETRKLTQKERFVIGLTELLKEIEPTDFEYNRYGCSRLYFDNDESGISTQYLVLKALKEIHGEDLLNTLEYNEHKN